MSEPAHFENAADYQDWWFYSGTALGAVSPEIYFSVPWDEEHGLRAELDENGEIVRWF